MAMRQLSGRKDGTPPVEPLVMRQANSRGDVENAASGAGGEEPVDDSAEEWLLTTKSSTESANSGAQERVDFSGEEFDTGGWFDVGTDPDFVDLPEDPDDCFFAWSNVEWEAWTTPDDLKIGANTTGGWPNNVFAGRSQRSTQILTALLTGAGYSHAVIQQGHTKIDSYTDVRNMFLNTTHSYGSARNLTAKCRIFVWKITDLS